MKTIYRLFVILALSFVALNAKAQNDGIAITLLPNSLYSNYFNPGIRVESKGMIGIGFSNIGASVYNSSVRYNNIYNFENGKAVSINANKLVNSLNEHDNYIGTNISMDVLGLGYRITDKLYLDLNWRVRSNAEFHYSRDFVGFFINGNGNYMGEENYADFTFGLDINIFSEISVGLQYDINEKLTVGVRPKLLAGVLNARINDDNTKIYTDSDTYEMIGDIILNTKVSSILDADLDKLSESVLFQEGSVSLTELMKFKDNYGFGVDFGASYTFNEHFGVAAGVYDLGFIKWKNTKEKYVEKENVVISEPIAGDFDALLDMNLDLSELYKNLFRDVWGADTLHSADDYTTSLKTRIILQGYYELNSFARFTAISQMYYVNQKLRPALTLAYSGSFLDILNVTANYTLSKYSGNYLGVGLGINVAFMNIYVVTDNIMILSNIGASASKLLTSYESANLRFGIVFSL